MFDEFGFPPGPDVDHAAPVLDTFVYCSRAAEGVDDVEVDRIIVATGFRPDLSLLSELRIAIDPATEAPPALSPLIVTFEICVACGQPSNADSIWPHWLESSSIACLPMITRRGCSLSTMALSSLATASGCG